MMCKHFDTQRGCGMGDKCQFAHGSHDMRASDEVKFKILIFYISLFLKLKIQR